MANLFSFRATQPSVLLTAKDPIGLENDQWLLKLAEEAGIIVAAWGNHGAYLGRSDKIKKLIPDLQYIKLNKTGQPAHPLYQPASMMPTQMST